MSAQVWTLDGYLRDPRVEKVRNAAWREVYFSHIAAYGNEVDNYAPFGDTEAIGEILEAMTKDGQLTDPNDMRMPILEDDANMMFRIAQFCAAVKYRLLGNEDESRRAIATNNKDCLIFTLKALRTYDAAVRQSLSSLGMNPHHHSRNVRNAYNDGLNRSRIDSGKMLSSLSEILAYEKQILARLETGAVINKAPPVPAQKASSSLYSYQPFRHSKKEDNDNPPAPFATEDDLPPPPVPTEDDLPPPPAPSTPKKSSSTSSPSTAAEVTVKVEKK